MTKQKIDFAKRTLIFLVVLVIVILMVNLIYTNFILTKKTFYHKEIIYREYISNMTEKEFDYVFFGDSHAFHAVNPDFIPNSYNYATGAENYIKTYYKLRKMIYQDNVDIDYIVLEIDLHTFSTRLTDETNLFSETELYSQFVSLSEIENVRKDDTILSLWL